MNQWLYGERESGEGGWEKGVTTDTVGDDGYHHTDVVLVLQVYTYVQTYQLYTLNMCHSFYAYYTSTKLFKNVITDFYKDSWIPRAVTES